MTVGFKNITKCQIKSKISASDTTILLENTADYVPFISSPGDYVYAVLQDQYHKEIVKIDVSASSIYGLTVGRGQESTTARIWNRGSLFYQDLTADSLDLLRQKEVFRTLTYNPNGITAPAYAYEKVYQTGATECEKRWWKSINDTHLIWVLLAGTICDGETWVYPDDPGWDWDTPPAWEWPVIAYTVVPPIFLPDGGVYTLAQDVEIFCPTLNSTIYYTDDGSTPDDNSTEYTGLIHVSVTTTLKAIAYKSGFEPSSVVTAEYLLATWTVITSSYQTVVAITENGELWGWGNNYYYQLSLPTEQNTYVTTPIQIDEGPWADVACGLYSTHAIKADGTLWSCGSNDYGQLGVGDFARRKRLTQVGSATNWAKVFSYSRSVYAIKTDGSLWVWGRNDSYALGLGDDTDRSSPVQLGALTNYSAISPGGLHAIALKTDGTLWAWGLNNGANQLGLGDSVTRTTPVQIGSSTDWAKLSSKSRNVTLVVKTNGTLWVWGDDYNGQCGQGTSGSATRYDYATPTQIGTSTNWKAATPNGSSGCMATKTNGTIWAWGNGSYGQLGLGNTTQYTVPMSASLDTDWDYPVGGGAHYTMYAIKTNKFVYSTGYYPQWALGLGALTQEELEGTPGLNYIHVLTRVDI